jgi:DNA-binding beta-propeller fold protein YncE
MPFPGGADLDSGGPRHSFGGGGRLRFLMSTFCISRAGWVNLALAVCCSAVASAGTFGKVVAIGGHASDLALDEARGVLYVANFTANRIEVVSLADHSVQRSMNVASQPGSLALSPDGKYLVITHFGNFVAPNSSSNAITVVNLASGSRQTFGLGAPPLGVAFGVDNRAFIATQNDFILLIRRPAPPSCSRR